MLEYKYPILIVSDFSTSHCVHCLNTGDLFTSLCITVLPPTPALLLFLQFLFWLEIVLDYFNTFSLYPVGSLFRVGRITLVNTFPFGTKLESHSPVKESLDKKIVSSTPPHLTAHLPLNTLSSQFPPFFVPTISTVYFLLSTVLTSRMD